MRNRIGAVMPKGVANVCAIAAVIVLTNGSALAADDCLAAPNLDPPQGSHWYYRVDGVQQRRCWYLGPEGQKVRHVEPEVQLTAKSAAPMRTETAGDRLAASTQVEPPLPPPRPATAASALAQESVDGLAEGARQGTPSFVQWPDADQAAGASNRETGGASTLQDIDGKEGAARPAAASKREAGGASTLQDIDGKEGTARPAAASVENARAIMLIRAVLLLVSTLAVAGILQHAIWIVVKRRRRVYVERDRAEPVVSNAREQTLPDFAASQNDLKHAPVEQIDPQDFAEGIRQLLRAMERRAA